MARLTIAWDRLEGAVHDEMYGLGNAGFCLGCGEEAGGCEPDARNYMCEGCGEPEVFGAAEIMVMERYHIIDGSGE